MAGVKKKTKIKPRANVLTFDREMHSLALPAASSSTAHGGVRDHTFRQQLSVGSAERAQRNVAEMTNAAAQQ